MRKSIHTKNLNLRISDSIFAKVQQRADERGMTMAELARQALRRELGDAA